MNINGKHYVRVLAEIYDVPDESVQSIKIENGTIWVQVVQGNTRLWVSADSLKSRVEADRILVERLIGELSWMINTKGVISKAEAKRRLLSCGVISK